MFFTLHVENPPMAIYGMEIKELAAHIGNKRTAVRQHPDSKIKKHRSHTEASSRIIYLLVWSSTDILAPSKLKQVLCS